MKYHFPHKLYPHQAKALKFLLRNRGGGLQVPMRWGKTAVAIHFAGCLHLLEGAERVLVVCPLSVVGVWENEIPKHSSVPWQLVYDPESPDFPPHDGVQWHVINFEQVYDRYRDEDGSWFPVPNKGLERYGADLIIVDESHHIGNPQAEVSKHLYRLGRKASFRLIMTGTMFHRKPFYVFGQAKFYDPSIFGTAWTSFKKQIAVFGGYGDYEVKRYINLKWMIDKVKPWVYMEDNVPPRDTAINVLYFHLSGRNLHQYVEMEKEAVIEVEGERVVSPIILSRHLRCQQIAGGWVKTGTKYRRVGDNKLRICKDRFAEYAAQDIDKVVVGCRFIPELADAAQAARQAGYRVLLLHGGVPKDERTRRIRCFRDTEQPTMFIAQIAAAREGIDLSAASVMMFYSLPESYVDYDQFKHRILKYGKRRVLQYDYLVARGTRDEVTFESLKLKQDVATFIAKKPRYVERISEKLAT